MGRILGIDARSFSLGLFSSLLLALALFWGGSLPLPPALHPASGFGPAAPSSCVQATPLFSPGSSSELQALISSARSSIEVEMYVLSDPDLASALAQAAARGVRVRVILEPRIDSSTADPLAATMRAGGVEVRWASLQYALTHSKMMIIDMKKVLVGSINFSRSAQKRNREAAVVLSGDVVKPYIDVFEKDWADASKIRSNQTAMGG